MEQPSTTNLLDLSMVVERRRERGTLTSDAAGGIGDNAFCSSSSVSSLTENEAMEDATRQMELASKLVAAEENRSAHQSYLGSHFAAAAGNSSLRSSSATSLGDLSDLEALGVEGVNGNSTDDDSDATVSTAAGSATNSTAPSPTSLNDVQGKEIGGATATANDTDDYYSQLDRYGFIVVAQQQQPREKTPVGASAEERELRRKQEARGKKEARRAIKWVNMLKVIEMMPVEEVRINWILRVKKFESRLVKGIPECLRTKVWAMFLGLHAYAAEGTAGAAGAVASAAPSTATTATPSSRSNYQELYLKISGFERQIDLDIERTLRDHILFKSRFSSAQVSLFKILVAYSNYDTEVGYCQGMSTTAAFLLLYFEEEVAFSMLRTLMARDGLRHLFTAGFPMLFETFWVQEQLMKKYLPLLHRRLESFHITSSVYATKWYLTLFLGFPFALATRIWDLFLYYGLDMLICVSLALLKMFETRLLSLEYEATMQFLSKLPEYPIDEGRLIRLTWQIWRRIYPYYNDPDPGQRDRRNPFNRYRVQYGKLHVSERRKH